MMIQFDHIYELQLHDWFAKDTRAECEALQREEAEILAERDALQALKSELESAATIDVDHEALNGLPRLARDIAIRELKYRQRRVVFQKLFARDRSAEQSMSAERYDEAFEGVRKKLMKMGYQEGPANKPGTFYPGTFYPGMVMRHPDVHAARIYAYDIGHVNCHHPENLTAVASLERQLEKLRTDVTG